MANKLPSVLQSGTSNYLTPSLSFNRVPTDLFTSGITGAITNTSGVAPAVGSFAVNAQGSPNMTVAVSAGVAYVLATPTGGTAQRLAITSDATENVTIASNATGSTKYDFVYIKVDPDKMNNPAATALDVVTLITQRSSTPVVDSNSAPTNSLLLAQVTVANGAATIANASITDYRFHTAATQGGGWTPVSDAWAYASANTITVPTGAAGKYAVGDKIRIWQGATPSYFYIVSLTDTVLTVIGDPLSPVANSAILNPQHSRALTPIGFPQWFNYTATETGFSSTTPTRVTRIRLIGHELSMHTTRSNNQTSNSTAYTFSLPVAAATIANMAWYGTVSSAQDNSSGGTAVCVAKILSAGTIATLFTNANGNVWTASGTKGADFSITYEI